MSGELVPVHRDSVDNKIRYAKALAEAGLLPAAYRRQPGNVLLAVEFGEALGLHPVAAINGLHIVDGKPTASAALISALVRRAGHRLRITGDDHTATAEIIRADDPAFVFTSTWTLDRAESAGLLSKPVWQAYPAAMLKARAITEAARDACQEALSGVQYTPEELGADTADEPAAALQSAPAAAAAEVIDAEVTEVENPAGQEDWLITDLQLIKLHAQLGDFGVTDRDHKLRILTAILGTPISSSRDLTLRQASDVIETLAALADHDQPADHLADVLGLHDAEPNTATSRANAIDAVLAQATNAGYSKGRLDAHIGQHHHGKTLDQLATDELRTLWQDLGQRATNQPTGDTP